jgi:hypothetical protein
LLCYFTAYLGSEEGYYLSTELVLVIGIEEGHPGCPYDKIVEDLTIITNLPV